MIIQRLSLKHFFNHTEFEKSILETIEFITKFLDRKQIEIFDFGCGDGSFLRKMKESLKEKSISAKILGYDVGAYSKTLGIVTGSKSDFEQQIKSSTATLITARHVLEYLTDLDDFFSIIQKNKCLVYLEVPNGAQPILSDNFEDLVYEHVSYFSYVSLINAINRNNLIPIASFNSLNGEISVLSVSITTVGTTPSID